MNKNTIIGILLVVVILGLGFYLSKRPQEITYVDNTSISTTTPVSTTPTPETPPAQVKPDAPNVETSANNGTSISTASVTGKVRPNGSSTTYWYEYGETSSLGSRTTAQSIGSSYSYIPSPGYITGLRASTLYYYRLNAKNSLGTVNGSMYTLQTNTTPAAKGAVPTVRTNNVSTITRISATANGTLSSNGAGTVYWFEYGKTNSLGSISALLSSEATASNSPVSVILSGLDPVTRYYYRLNAQNQYGTVIGGTMSFTTAGPANASKPTVDTTSASSTTNNSAILNGRLNANGADTSYWFEYSQDSLLGTLIGTGTTRQTMSVSTDTKSVTANITNLASNIRYYYRLVAENQYGTVRGDIESFKTR